MVGLQRVAPTVLPTFSSFVFIGYMRSGTMYVPGLAMTVAVIPLSITIRLLPIKYGEGNTKNIRARNNTTITHNSKSSVLYILFGVINRAAVPQ
ncbi:hypothetical protein M1295_00625 [Patescibacteria group bacterium]|nr:hypothetical protein [Patescibacteria group bacterium]